jgi:transmembrane sensor
MENFNEHIDHLIFQYSEGTISPDETEELLSWIEKDTENKKYFKEQIAVLRNVQTSLVHFNAKKGLSEFHKLTRKVPHYSLPIRLIAIAASIVLILIVGKVSINQLSDSTPEVIEYAAQKRNLTERLDDNTEITLSRNSVLLKPKQFTRKNRKVRLTGKAFFEVAKDKNRPFIINCGNIDITVIGTAFEVETDTIANWVKVAVSNGIVSVKNKKSDLKKNVTEGMQVKVSQRGVLLDESKIKNENYLSWKTGILIFNNTPMAGVAEELAKLYGKKIIFKDENLENENITTKIDNQPISEVTMMLEVILNAKIDERGDTLIFRTNTK